MSREESSMIEAELLQRLRAGEHEQVAEIRRSMRARRVRLADPVLEAMFLRRELLEDLVAALESLTVEKRGAPLAGSIELALSEARNARARLEGEDPAFAELYPALVDGVDGGEDEIRTRYLKALMAYAQQVEVVEQLLAEGGGATLLEGSWRWVGPSRLLRPLGDEDIIEIHLTEDGT